MTDLERKLIETLREQAEEVTPSADAWSEHQRRMLSRNRRPSKRSLTVVLAPIVAVVVLVTAHVFLPQVPVPQVGPADQSRTYMHVLRGPFEVSRAIVGGEAWVAYFARVGLVTSGPNVFDCFFVVPQGSRTDQLAVASALPGYPQCDTKPTRSGDALLTAPVQKYVLSRTVYVVSSKVQALRVFGEHDVSLPVTEVGRAADFAVFATLTAEAVTRFEGTDSGGMVISQGR
jgi:hypothetical protein